MVINTLSDLNTNDNAILDRSVTCSQVNIPLVTDSNAGRQWDLFLEHEVRR